MKHFFPILFLSLIAQEPVFKATTQLVVETVVVKDKDGNPITGLTAKDFAITEDGVPQQIRFFEFQKLDAAAPPVVVPDSERARALPRLTRTQISPEPPGDIKYRFGANEK